MASLAAGWLVFAVRRLPLWSCSSKLATVVRSGRTKAKIDKCKFSRHEFLETSTADCSYRMQSVQGAIDSKKTYATFTATYVQT